MGVGDVCVARDDVGAGAGGGGGGGGEGEGLVCVLCACCGARVCVGVVGRELTERNVGEISGFVYDCWFGGGLWDCIVGFGVCMVGSGRGLVWFGLVWFIGSVRTADDKRTTEHWAFWTLQPCNHPATLRIPF